MHGLPFGYVKMFKHYIELKFEKIMIKIFGLSEKLFSGVWMSLIIRGRGKVVSGCLPFLL